MFNFKRLIDKFGKYPVYLLEESEGYHNPKQGGKWVPGEIEEIKLEDAAVVPLSNEDLRFDEGGTYTVADRKLYCYKEMTKGNKIKHKESLYTILESKDYTDFDEGLYIYIIKKGE